VNVSKTFENGKVGTALSGVVGEFAVMDNARSVSQAFGNHLNGAKGVLGASPKYFLNSLSQSSVGVLKATQKCFEGGAWTPQIWKQGKVILDLMDFKTMAGQAVINIKSAEQRLAFSEAVTFLVKESPSFLRSLFKSIPIIAVG